MSVVGVGCGGQGVGLSGGCTGPEASLDSPSGISLSTRPLPAAAPRSPTSLSDPAYPVVALTTGSRDPFLLRLSQMQTSQASGKQPPPLLHVGSPQVLLRKTVPCNFPPAKPEKTSPHL